MELSDYNNIISLWQTSEGFSSVMPIPNKALKPTYAETLG